MAVLTVTSVTKIIQIGWRISQISQQMFVQLYEQQVVSLGTKRVPSLLNQVNKDDMMKNYVAQ